MPGSVCRAIAIAILFFASIHGRSAMACAVCGAADKTLPVRGEETAFAGRVRATVDVRLASFAARHAPLRIVEARLVGGAAMAVGEDVLVSVEAPLLRRVLSSGGERWMLGDVEARASFVGYRSSSRRLTLHGGAKAPTAPLEHAGDGRFVPTDLQPGCGSIVPLVGATYTLTGPVVSFWSSVSLLLPSGVRGGPHPGDSLRAAMTVQVQPARRFAVRLSAHGRIDAAGDIDDQVDPRSGGASVFGVTEVVASPLEDLVLSAGVAVPVVQETRGHRVTAPILVAGIGWDF